MQGCATGFSVRKQESGACREQSVSARRIPPHVGRAVPFIGSGRIHRTTGRLCGFEFVLVKERPGALSLWNAGDWQTRLDRGVQLIHSKLEAGRLAGRTDEVQQFGRLLSTRHRSVQLAGRGRLVVPEGFREFLGVDPGGDVMVVGAALCVELWQPAAWIQYLHENMPEFHRLFEGLSA